MISEKAKSKYAQQFPKVNWFTIVQAFGGWTKAHEEHFADGGSFDEIYTRKKGCADLQGVALLPSSEVSIARL